MLVFKATRCFVVTAMFICLATGCSNDEPSPFGSHGGSEDARDYRGTDDRKLRCVMLTAGDTRAGGRGRYIAVVVLDISELERAGFEQRMSRSGGGGGGGKIFGSFDREFVRKSDGEVRHYPISITAMDWDSYYINGSKYSASSGRLLLWKPTETDEPEFSGPYPLSGDHAGAIWEALDEARPEYRPRNRPPMVR